MMNYIIAFFLTVTNTNQQLQEEKILLHRQAKEKETQQNEIQNFILNLTRQNKQMRQAVTKGMLSVTFSELLTKKCQNFGFFF